MRKRAECLALSRSAKAKREASDPMILGSHTTKIRRPFRRVGVHHSLLHILSLLLSIFQFSSSSTTIFSLFRGIRNLEWGGGFGPDSASLRVSRERGDCRAGVVLAPSGDLLLPPGASGTPQDASKPPPGRLHVSFKTLKNRPSVVRACGSCFYFAV